MTIYAVEYTYDITRGEDRDTLRPEHRAFLSGLLDSGSLIASGPWLDNAAPGALLLMRGQSDEQIARVLDDDPFQRAKLITHRTFRPWDPILGSLGQD